MEPILFPMDDDLQRIREKKLEELKRGFAEKPAAKPGGQVLVLDERQFPAAVRDNPYLVVDMWAPWCGPCRMVAPVIQELSAEFAGKISFAKVNTDENPRIAMNYGITAIPTILLFAQGKLVEKVIGAYPKQMLRDRILRSFGMTG
jgi:thioredoxin 1